VAARGRAANADRQAADEARAALQPVFDRLVAIENELAPSECIKTQLAEARARYRELTDAFVDELKTRCAVMSEDKKRALVLELFAQDVQAGLDAAVGERRQELVRFVESLWDKYRISLDELQRGRVLAQQALSQMLERLQYA
jgi:type I restriction enzyme M protein